MTQLVVTTPDELQALVRMVLRQELGNLPPRQPDQRKYDNVDEACQFLNITRSTLYQFTSQRLIPFTKSGRRLMFVRSELEEWLTSRRKATRQEIANEIANKKLDRK